MQRLIVDPPGTELGGRGGPEVEHHSPRSLVDDGTLLPVSERPAGTTAEVQAEEPLRDIGEKMGGWFRAFAAEIAGCSTTGTTRGATSRSTEARARHRTACASESSRTAGDRDRRPR